VDVAKGTFTMTTDGSDSVVAGLGFQPKLVFFWTAGRTSTGIAAGTGGWSFGAASGTSEQGWCGLSSLHGNTNMDTGKYQRNDSCIGALSDGAPTVDSYLALSSFDAGGFTLSYTDASTVARLVHYLALGGSDLTSVKVGTTTFPTSGATFDTTGVGFQPNKLILFGVRGGTMNAGSAHGQFHIGATDGSTHWGQAMFDADAVGSSSCAITFSSSQLVRMFTENATISIDVQAAFSAWLADGFTLSAANHPAATVEMFYVAMSSSGVTVGSDTAATTNTTKSTTAQDPDAVLFATVMSSADDGTATTSTASGAGVAGIEVGAMTTAAQGMASQYSDDNTGNGVISRRHVTTDVMFMGDPGNPAATMGTASYSALGSTDFTLSWASTNGTAHRFGFVSFGVPPAVGFTPRLALMGVG
jgi:hypothetical protein